MKTLKATKNFELNGIFYKKDDIVKVENIKELVKLNEGGYIEPLTLKEIQKFQFKKEDLKDATII